MNASLSVMADSEHEPRRLALDSKDINAIAAFAQKRMRLPKDFLLKSADDLQISADARAIIYILLDNEKELLISDSDRVALSDIAENFKTWASNATVDPKTPGK